MNEPSEQAMQTAAMIWDIKETTVRAIARIIDEEQQKAITLACRAHKEKQELLIAFIHRLGSKDPVLESEVKDQFRLWNLRPNGQPSK